jgi:BASS family bile acid:Na+ symporter
MFETLNNIDHVRMNFSEGGLLFMNITLAFIMFGVALDIKMKQFKDILAEPKAAIVGILSQIILLPMLTFLLIRILNPPPSVAMGMILIAACPGGNISNLISSLSKANVALSVSLTAFSTLSSSLTTPLNFAFWGSLYVRYYEKAKHLNIPIEIDFWQMFQTVFLLLGLPLLAGMWFNYNFPVLALRLFKPIKAASGAIYLVFIVAAFYVNIEFLPPYILPIGILVFFLNTQTMITGFITSTLAKLKKSDRRTIAIETGIQNSGLALVLIFNPKLFDGNGGMAFMAAWWGIWQMISGLAIAWFLARIKINDEIATSK